MSVLTQPRHPIVDTALGLAADWCDGHIIDQAPALGHAVKVARTLDKHLPNPPAELIAAALLHDAPDFAPPALDLDAVLTNRLSQAVTQTVRALEREHRALDSRLAPAIAMTDAWTLYASAADKIVAVTSVLRRAARARDPEVFWCERQAFTDRVPYFRAFVEQASSHLPPIMTAELNDLVTRAEKTTITQR